MQKTSKTLRALIVADPIEPFKFEKDSIMAIIKALQEQGARVFMTEPHHLALNQEVPGLSARVREIEFQGFQPEWYHVRAQGIERLQGFDIIFMRVDPPITERYLYACQILSMARAQGVRVVNQPQALLGFNEKLLLSLFPDCLTDTRVTQEAESILEFVNQHRDTIFKPLQGMGGAGIYRVKHQDVNLHVIIEQMTNFGRQPIMVQRYLPEIVEGDKRILLLEGAPVPYAVARLPKAGETRANLAAGGRARVQPLTDRDRWLCARVGERLKNLGFSLVGLDVIGDFITEINVTSPTCFREILKETQFDVAAQLINALKVCTL